MFPWWYEYLYVIFLFTQKNTFEVKGLCVRPIDLSVLSSVTPMNGIFYSTTVCNTTF